MKKGYIAERLLYTAIITWGVMTAAFIILRIGPGSPADKYIANLGAGHNVTQVAAAIEARYGVNRPLHEQYIEYMSSLLHGDWGWSFSTSMPVMELIKTHWVYSFQLVLLSSIFAIVLGLLIGMYSAVKKGTRADYIATFFFCRDLDPEFLAWHNAYFNIFCQAWLVPDVLRYRPAHVFHGEPESPCSSCHNTWHGNGGRLQQVREVIDA